MSDEILPSEHIKSRIYFMRGQKMMLDRDLAELYGVETGALNQAVRRNIEKFPGDFMFQLTKEEVENWISQIVITNSINMGLRKQPYAFTEQGIAMLSGRFDDHKNNTRGSGIRQRLNERHTRAHSADY